MADILKVSTPLVERAPVNPTRPVGDAAIPFDLSDVSRVIRTPEQSELLQQNNGLAPHEDAPKILADLLKDPSVTVGLMKNISLLQEVINLLPANNSPLTQELRQLFSSLMLQPGEIVEELQRQDQSTTLFKGDLFDQLRTLLVENAGKPGFSTGVGVLLKSLNATLSRSDALNSVANNLSFLGDSLSASPRLSGRIDNLVRALRSPDAQANFATLKEEVASLLKDIESSVLFTPKMEKVVPLVTYNLSRYNDNDDFFPETLKHLLSKMDGDASKELLVRNLALYLNHVAPEAFFPSQEEQNGGIAALLEKILHFTAPGSARRASNAEEDSRVMDTLSKIVGKGAGSDELQLLSGDKINRIVHSLLSSPCNFTPLLHFIVPVEYMDLRAFAEIWIDPNAGGDEGRKNAAVADNSHMLMVFDVEGIGRFESEVYVQNKRIALNLLCPPPYLEAFKGVGPAIRQAVAPLGYSFEAINIDKLEHTHSLMDVFTDLPQKRTGIDVRI